MSLKLTIILNLFTILVVFLSSTHSQQIEADVDVLVLGSGIAGIAAARTLQAADPNLSVLVLDGATSVGGRIRNARLRNTNPNDTDVYVSVGAQWLHGRGNPLYDYALEKGFIVEDGSEEGLGSYIRDDKFEPDSDFLEMIHEIVEEISDECMKFANDSSIPYPRSFDEFLTMEFENRIAPMSTQDKIVARQILDWHKRFIVVDNAASSIEAISAKEWGRIWYAGGEWEHIGFKNGFAEVIQTMASELKPKTILFNKRVTNIDYDLMVDRILVRTEDISYYTAKHVIVTFSLGILKEHERNIFNPPLPIIHREAIHCMGYGSITMIIIQFHENWWNDEEGLQLLFDNPNTINPKWTRYLTGFDKDMSNENTFVGWVGGQGVRELEQIPEEEIIADVLRLLNKHTGIQAPWPRRYYMYK